MSHAPNPWTVDTLGTEGIASHFLLGHGTFKDSVSQDVYKAPPLNKLAIKTVFIICIIFQIQRLFLQLPSLEVLVILHLPIT